MKKIFSHIVELVFLLMLSGCYADQKHDFAGMPSPQNEQKQKGNSLEQPSMSTKKTTNKYGTADAIADLAKMGVGDSIFMHSTRRGKYYRHKHYTLSYSERDEQAEWVSYELTYDEVLARHLKATDTTAMTLAMDNHMKLVCFALADPENIIRVVCGEKIGTIVKED